MRTENDVRSALDIEDDHEALARLTAFADDLDGGAFVDLQATPSPTRRRVVPVLAAAAAVVVVAGGGVALVHLRNGGSRQASSGRLSAEQRRPVWNLRVARMPGYIVTRVTASSIGLASGSTTAIASRNATRPERGVMTTCPLTFRACADPSGSPHSAVTVDGRPGYFARGGHVERGALTRGYYRAHPWRAAFDDDRAQAYLTWDAGHHTTVFLHGTFGFDPHTYSYDDAATKRIMLRIASAVSAGHRDATHLPFELRGLPGRVAPQSVRIEHGSACGGYGTGPRNENDPLGEVFTACRVRTGATRAATVAAADRADSNRENGSTRFETEQPVVHDYADGTSLVIAVERHSIVSQRQARRIAARADMSPRLGVTATWFAVS